MEEINQYNNLKINDIVIYINNKNLRENITQYKKYKVVYTHKCLLVIRDDFNHIDYFNYKNFVSLKEYRKLKLKKINENR